MKFYDAQVYLSGSRLHQVPKQGITAAEILMLQFLHGDDAVVDVRESKTPWPIRDENGREEVNPTKRTNAKERARLEEVYGAEKVKERFGLAHNRLPVELELDPVDEPEDDEEGDPGSRTIETRPDPLVKARAVRAEKIAARRAAEQQQEAASALAE